MTDSSHPHRRGSDVAEAVKVTDTADSLTLEELHALKKVAGYYAAGRLVLAVVVGLGAAVVGLVEFWDALSRYVHK